MLEFYSVGLVSDRFGVCDLCSRHCECFTSEHHFEKFPSFSNGGIIVASVEEVLQNFSRLVGCHDIRDKQLLVEDLLAPKGQTCPFETVLFLCRVEDPS